MNILILGGGGREHALAWAFAQNPKCDRLWCAPGNAGIAEEATCVALDILDGEKVAGLRARERYRLRDGRPEAPLAEGVADVLRARRHPDPRPGARAARSRRPRPSPRRSAPPAAPRPPPARPSPTPTPPAPMSRAGRADRGQGRRPRRRQGRDRRRDRRRGARGARRDLPRRPRRAGVVIEEFMDGEEASLFVLADGETCCRSAPPRTTSAPSTATAARTPAAWAPTRRRR